MTTPSGIGWRQVFRVAAGVIAMVLGCCSVFGQQPDRNAKNPARRPNVVFLLADQWRAQATGYAGDPNVKTPHLDRLASQGVSLANAVSGCPVCSPYRGSLITGQYPLRHGVFLNDVCLGNQAVSLAEAFGRAGYRTAYIGKWHLDGHGRSNFIPPERRHGFQFWRGNECSHDYNRSPYYAGDDPTRLVWDGYDAIAQTEEAARYIRGHREGPFLLVLSWGPPHNPYQTAPERFRKLYRPEDLVLRPNVPQEMHQQARRDLAGYYAHCSALDECLGRIVETLAQQGLERDTILVFTSDHGDMLGSQGQERKQRPWDESIRVPLVIRWPAALGGRPRKLIRPINTPDLMPTLLGLCGIAVPKTVEGSDFSRLVLGSQADGDGAALLTCVSPFGEWTRQRGGREYRGLRTARYTYARSREGPWLLYDNQRDPYQQQNLVGRPEHAALQADLDARLTKMLAQTHDEFRPGADYVKQWGYATDAAGTAPYKP
jgi:arylsulfatase A-like enzyme